MSTAVDIERNLLATLLMNGGAGLDETEDRLQPTDFASDQHRQIYLWVLGKVREKKVPDFSILLSENGDCVPFGGISYLQSLVSYAGPKASVSTWANRVHDEARVHRIRHAGQQIVELTNENTMVASDIAAESEKIILDATSDKSGEGPRPISELIHNRMNEWDLIRTGEMLEYFPSGFKSFDDAYIGWPKGYPVIIGGRTKMGKSMFMLSAVLRGAYAGVPQGIISIEMPASTLMDRLASIRSGIPANEAHGADVDKREQLYDALREVNKLPISVDDASRHVETIESSVRRMSRRYGAKVIWLDYMQLVRPTRLAKEPGSWAELDEISDSIRAIAKAENVCIVSMMQFNREGEHRSTDGKRGYPSTTAFRGSDKPLFDAAIAFGLYRPWHYQPPTDEDTGDTMSDTTQATMRQPLDLVCLACRYAPPKNLHMRATLATQRLYDESD